jgi:hypothetical protein
MTYVVIIMAVLLGFVAGLVALKRSSRWCPACGDLLRCAHCPGRPSPAEAREALRAMRTRR